MEYISYRIPNFTTPSDTPYIFIFTEKMKSNNTSSIVHSQYSALQALALAIYYIRIYAYDNIIIIISTFLLQ